MTRKNLTRRILALGLALAIGAMTVGSTIARISSSPTPDATMTIDAVARGIRHERQRSQEIVDRARTEAEALDGIRALEAIKSQSERQIQEAQVRHLRAEGRPDDAARLERELSENESASIVGTEDGGQE